MSSAASITSLPTGEDALYEVVNGEIVELTPMGAYQVWIASQLQRRLGNFAEQHALGRVVTEMLFDLTSSIGMKRRPDVAFVSYERWPRERPVPDTEAWDVVPNLAVEVVSPTNPADAVVDKVGEYFQAGVQLVWIIYSSQRQVYVYSSPTSVEIIAQDDSIAGNSVLPGFQLDLGQLFDDGTHVPESTRPVQ